VRIYELTLATNDLAAQSAFWREKLGLPTRAGDGQALELVLRRSVIRFEQAAGGIDARYHFAINIPTARSTRRRGG
jgi:catechol-2,3-dioxygenase